MSAASRPPVTNAAKGALFMGLFGVVWAVIEWLGGSLSAHYSPYQVVWSRYLVHLLLSIAVLFTMRRSISIRTRRWRVELLRSAMMLIMPVTFVMAAHRGSPGSVWSLLWLAPILTMAAGRLLRGTAVTAIDWTIAVVCFAGIVLTLHPDTDVSPQGASFALLSAASLAGYLIMTVELRAVSIWVSLFYTAVVPFVVLSALMPAVWTPVSLHAGIVFVAIGVTGWLGLMALDKSIRLLMPAHAAVFIYVQVVMDTLIVHGLDGARTVIGIGMLMCGLMCAAFAVSRRHVVAAAGMGTA